MSKRVSLSCGDFSPFCFFSARLLYYLSFAPSKLNTFAKVTDYFPAAEAKSQPMKRAEDAGMWGPGDAGIQLASGLCWCSFATAQTPNTPAVHQPARHCFDTDRSQAYEPRRQREADIPFHSYTGFHQSFTMQPHEKLDGLPRRTVERYASSWKVHFWKCENVVVVDKALTYLVV